MNVDLKIIEAIMVSGIGGFGVKAITNWIKSKVSELQFYKRLKDKGFLNYLISLVVCAGAVVAYLIPVGWNWASFAIYTGFVFASANGFYRALPKKG